MKRKNRTSSDDLRREYTFDYSKGVRGKYYRRFMKEGSNIVKLEPDVAKVFRNSEAVNDALRSLLKVSESAQRYAVRARRTARKRHAA
ncbi:MAG: hypothetical protein WB402_10865 [Sulfuricaulis sp.]|uniref:hypothetical protein n=1 Tax=Sulfuricaulis sp. TaxID=2003553 RepID=UPI003C3639C4